MPKMDNCCSPGRKVADKKLTKSTNNQSHSHGKKKRNSQEDMVYIPGGNFMMGTNDDERNLIDGEGPIRKVKVDPFYMDVGAVTNQAFREFVNDTGYVTEAEEYGWSFVFHMFVSELIARDVAYQPAQTSWWYVVEDATWEQPEGPDSHIEDRLDHPVVHISWNDALAYAEWADKRLPTEAEWEYAARGGLEQKKYPWGDELVPEGEHRCNIWQGIFPKHNTEEDGFNGTAPAKYYDPNGYGLYNIVGNVWEWCSDWFGKSIHNRGGRDNPTGAEHGAARVIRGGSYLCHRSYCNRYRVAARTSNTPDSSSGNMGFRCVTEVL